MKFTKMHGCGNDYVYVNLMENPIDSPDKLSIQISDRHYGIGSDGLITIDKSDIADVKMQIYNADGSEAEMCGNGIRCVGKFVYDKKITDKEEISVETKAGIKYLKFEIQNGKVKSVAVDMGRPELDAANIPVVSEKCNVISEELTVLDKTFNITCVSMGNPHSVVFVDDVDGFDLEKYGPLVEKNEIFPNRVNAEFVEVISENEIKMRVWERGSDETWACGTGACASVMACILNNKTKNSVKVHLRGGDLDISYDSTSKHIFMKGEAIEVYDGEIEI